MNDEIKFTNDIIEKMNNFFKSEIKEEDINLFHKELNKLSYISESLSVELLKKRMIEILICGNKKKKEFIEEVKNKGVINQAISIIIAKKKEKQFNTKKENILEQLKILQNEARNQKDTGAILDLEWIIRTINEENIYDISPLTNEELNKESNKNVLDYLMVYSKFGEAKLRNNDFMKVKSGCIKSRTFSKVENDNIFMNDNNNRKKNNILGNIVSPSLSAKITTLLTRLDYPDFDIFELDQLLQENASVVIANEIFKKIGIFGNDFVNEDTLRTFIKNAVSCYSRKNAYYHNDLHAADVMQTLFTFMIRGDLQKKMKLDDFDVFIMLVSALCHDLKHTGQNNTFHINTRSKIAMRYNDVSVLENYHIAQTFKLMQDEGNNILKLFKPEEYRILRRRMIEGILATDMAIHQNVIMGAKTKTTTYNIKKGDYFPKIFEVGTDQLFDAQQVILNLCIHTADISNPAKPSKISSQWTEKVYEEFFRQGDLEKKLNIQVSLMCDRNTTSINKAMIGFINFVVMPTFEIVFNLIPEVADYLDNLKGNLKKHEASYAIETKKNEEENNQENNK